MNATKAVRCPQRRITPSLRVFSVTLFFVTTLFPQAICAEPTSSLAVGISLARTAVNMLSGDTLGATVAGNRELLLGINKKLDDHTAGLRLIQERINQLPADVLKVHFHHDAIQKVNRAKKRFLEYTSIEYNYEKSAKYQISTTWRDYYDKLKKLQGTLESDLQEFKSDIDGLKNDSSPILMISEAATYSLLLQVVGQIIAVEKLMLSLNDKALLQMSFDFLLDDRDKLLDRSLDIRSDLAKSAVKLTRSRLQRHLLTEVTETLEKLDEFLLTNGTLERRFPEWAQKNSLSNNVISDGLYNIQKLLENHCPKSVPDSETWLHALVYELANTPRKLPARNSARNTEDRCGLNFGLLQDLQYLPYYPTSDRDRVNGNWTLTFRTPVYQRLVGPTVEPTFFKDGKYEVASRQYEVSVEWIQIDRIVSEVPAEQRWGPKAERLPGLDSLEIPFLPDDTKRSTETSDSKLSSRLFAMQSPVSFSWRSTFWWDSPGAGYHVPRIWLRDVLSSQDGTRHKQTFIRSTDTGTCFASIISIDPKFPDMVEDAVSRMTVALDVLPKQKLVPADWCSPPVKGFFLPSSFSDDPETWAKVINKHLGQIEYLLRIQAELERSYKLFEGYLSSLERGEEPELAYVIHPGSVAAKLFHEDLENFHGRLKWVEMTIGTRESMESVIEKTEEDIRYEQDKTAWAKGILLALAVAEIAFEYTTETDWIAEKKHGIDGNEDVEKIEVDIQNMNVDMETLLGQKQLDKKPEHKEIEEPSLVSSTPVLNFVGGLGLGKTGLVIIKSAGRAVGRLWLKRKTKKDVAMAFEKLKGQVVQMTRRGAIVSIHTGKPSPKVKDALGVLESALRKKESVLTVSKPLSFKDILDMGKRFICAGATACLATLKQPSYEGILLKSRDNLRQFRLGEKVKGGKLEANFETLAGGKRSRRNVHYDLFSQ